MTFPQIPVWDCDALQKNVINDRKRIWIRMAAGCSSKNANTEGSYAQNFTKCRLESDSGIASFIDCYETPLFAPSWQLFGIRRNLRRVCKRDHQRMDHDFRCLRKRSTKPGHNEICGSFPQNPNDKMFLNICTGRLVADLVKRNSGRKQATLFKDPLVASKTCRRKIARVNRHYLKNSSKMTLSDPLWIPYRRSPLWPTLIKWNQYKLSWNPPVLRVGNSWAICCKFLQIPNSVKVLSGIHNEKKKT